MESMDLSAVLDLAIHKEEEARAFYIDLAGMVEAKDARETLQFLAKEEEKHKEFLTRYRESGEGTEGAGALAAGSVVDYKVAQHLSAPDPSEKMESKDIFLLAAHREMHAYEFYRALSEIHPNGKTKEILLAMANEEMKHKEKVEYLYANTVFGQTAGG
jgi:rubrerythrin